MNLLICILENVMFNSSTRVQSDVLNMLALSDKQPRKLKIVESTPSEALSSKCYHAL